MAALVRDKMNASIGISIEGQIQNDKTARVFLGIVGPKNMPAVARSYSGRLMAVPDRVAYTALFELRKLLTDGN
jgi:nicotinamide mononucleotide (NMN) deamidase PncC